MKLLPVVSTDQLIERGVSLFKTKFPDAGEPEVIGLAPGRVNLIGEHTDYNEGFVLPLALEKQTAVVGKTTNRPDGMCRLVSEVFGGLVEFTAKRDLLPGDPLWANYVKGIVANFLRNNYEVPSFDAVVVSEVPMGGGVSSSASIEMATAVFLEGIGKHQLEPTKKALLCQAAEHEFANMPCGIMDQLISECALQDCALLIDCRSLSFEPVELKDPNTCILVCNSNVKHQLSGSEYPTRRKQCMEAVEALKRLDPRKNSLRDANLNELNEVKTSIDQITYRRAHHVITENNRTIETAKYLRSNDYANAGKRMIESHNSLRDDYEVSCKELDILVEIACSVPGVYGSRMTGAGFGGCTVTLLKKEAVDTVLQKIDQEYQAKTGIVATAFVTRPGLGAHWIKWNKMA
eukprot:jgi/Galph1/4862/GphlegSOOS_G3546.1